MTSLQKLNEIVEADTTFWGICMIQSGLEQERARLQKWQESEDFDPYEDPQVKTRLQLLDRMIQALELNP